MDSSAILWILTWSGVLSIAIFVMTGILGQLLPLIEAWRTLRKTLRGGSKQDAQETDHAPPTPEPDEPDSPDQWTASPEENLSAPGLAVGGSERDLAHPTPPASHQ